MKTRCSVAAVIRDGVSGDYLLVRRPPDDDRLPDAWGLPAVTLMPGELPEDGLRRVGREKLGADIEPIRFVGIRSADRDDYELVLMDIEARVVQGEPDYRKAITRSTRYVAQRWTSDLTALIPAAQRGSLCCQILLEASGFSYQTIP